MKQEIVNFAPFFTAITGLLVAFLSGVLFRKNKQTEYAMKLTEESIEKIYNPILLMIEKNSINNDGYDGLTFQEIQKIKTIFYDHRHLADEGLLETIIRFEEEAKHRYGYDKKDKSYFEIDIYDVNREFFHNLLYVRNNHLKRLGFSNCIKPSFKEIWILKIKNFMRHHLQYAKYLFESLRINK